MLQYNDNNLKEGNHLVYIKLSINEDGHFLYEDRLTLNKNYLIVNYEIDFNNHRYKYLSIRDDKNTILTFMLGSKLAEDFETIQDNRKRKLEKLNIGLIKR